MVSSTWSELARPIEPAIEQALEKDAHDRSVEECEGHLFARLPIAVFIIVSGT